MVNTQLTKIKEWLAMPALSAMMYGVLFGRAFLTIGIIVLFILAITPPDFKTRWKAFKENKLLWAISLLFFIPFISGIWTDDMAEWETKVTLKLGLLLLPIGFTFLISFSKIKTRLFNLMILLLLLGASIYSFLQYLPDMDAINESYKAAKVFWTPSGDDHIRFSWLIAIGIMLCFFIIGDKTNKLWLRWLAGLSATWFIIYLHILSAKTGLLCFYLLLLVFVIYQLFSKSNKWIGFVGLLLLLAAPYIAYKVFPTFKNRMGYIGWDLDHVAKGTPLAGSSDGARVRSMQAGFEIFRTHPILGVGYGDIRNEITQWYEFHFSDLPERDKLLPSNQFILFGLGAGIMGIITLVFVAFLPFTLSPHNRHYIWWAFNLGVLAMFLYEINLESQYGVFVYSFFLLWFWIQLIPNPATQQYEAHIGSHHHKK